MTSSSAVVTIIISIPLVARFHSVTTTARPQLARVLVNYQQILSMHNETFIADPLSVSSSRRMCPPSDDIFPFGSLSIYLYFNNMCIVFITRIIFRLFPYFDSNHYLNHCTFFLYITLCKRVTSRLII